MNPREKKALLLHPQLLGGGGIPRHGRCLVRIARRWCELNGVRLEIFSLNDPPASSLPEDDAPPTPVAGFQRAKARFVRSAVRAARRADAGWVLVGLANFLPALPLLAAASRLPVALVVHGIEAWKRLPLAGRFGLRFVDRVVAVSDFTRRRFCSLNDFPLDRCRVIHDTLDPAWLRRAAEARAERSPDLQGRPLLLSVARLDASEGYKGVDRVLQALPEILHRFPAALYLIIGDGDDRPRLEGLAGRAALSGHVRFLGRVPEDLLMSLYHHCDLFVLPSSGEGFGLVYLEAMACGKPVIAGAHGGAVEVVAEGVTGCLVDHDDVPRLAGRIAALLADPALRERMGRAGLRRAEERFGFEAIAQRWHAAFDDLIRGRSPLRAQRLRRPPLPLRLDDR